MRQLLGLMLLGLWITSCAPTTYNSGYYGKKRIVVKEYGYRKADQNRKEKYFNNANYRNKQIAKKIKH